MASANAEPRIRRIIFFMIFVSFDGFLGSFPKASKLNPGAGAWLPPSQRPLGFLPFRFPVPFAGPPPAGCLSGTARGGRYAINNHRLAMIVSWPAPSDNHFPGFPVPPGGGSAPPVQFCKKSCKILSLFFLKISRKWMQSLRPFAIIRPDKRLCQDPAGQAA